MATYRVAVDINSSEVMTYNSFASAAHTCRIWPNSKVYDSDGCVVYPVNSYYVRQGTSESGEFSNINDAINYVGVNSDRFVYDDRGNVVYPNNAYIVRAENGPATKHMDFESAKMAVLSDTDKKVYDFNGCILYQAPDYLPILRDNDAEVNNMFTEIYEKVMQAEEMLNSRILEE